MKRMFADLHIHTRCSRDSLMDPAKVVRVARQRGLAAIAVTDHDTVRGGLLAREASGDGDVTVIVGAEVRTEYGDVLGLFLEEEITARRFDDVVAEIRAQGGLAVLAHPYRGHPFPGRLAGGVDLIEGFNSRSLPAANARSMRLSQACGKGTVGGSDAHVYAEIGRGVTVFAGEDIEDALRAGLTAGSGRESSYYLVHALSCGIERLKGLSRAAALPSVFNAR
ncbi:MAG: phosphotransferase [Methanomicrobiales archaeon HGW-Methanomicrobiales-6]|nr:MAG: phosphotransferase [Methanomicrobiales archaeon HGW-Methanomicrobiales-6]